jgi:hypothetical protein
MFLATLICSDEACAEEAEVVVSHVEAADASVCACGCTHVLLAMSGWERAGVRALAPAA